MRKRTAETSLVSNQPRPSMRKIVSPKPSTSFFCHDRRGLNRQLILSNWSRSLPLLTFSASPPLPHFLPGWGRHSDLRSAGSGFTASSVPSSSSETARSDRDQFATSNRNDAKKYSPLESNSTTVSSSTNSASGAVMGAGSTGRIALSRPFR